MKEQDYLLENQCNPNLFPIGANIPCISELWVSYSSQDFRIDDREENPSLSLQDRLNCSHLFGSIS